MDVRDAHAEDTTPRATRDVFAFERGPLYVAVESLTPEEAARSWDVRDARAKDPDAEGVARRFRFRARPSVRCRRIADSRGRPPPPPLQFSSGS